MEKKIKLSIVISIFVVLIIGLILFTTYVKKVNEICGDGYCTKKEMTEGYCNLDCYEQCLGTTKSLSEEDCSIGWDISYQNLLIQENIDFKYLEETNEIDYTNPIIQNLAYQLRKNNPKETVKSIAKWTAENIVYDSTQQYEDCRSKKSTEIIERGTGVCSTMSKVNLALLRANGIASRSITGCFKYLEKCKYIQTIFRIKLPPFLQINKSLENIPTLGGLHNFVEVYLPEEGWVLLESTTGDLYENKCINYDYYYINPKDQLVCGLPNYSPLIDQCIMW